MTTPQALDYLLQQFGKSILDDPKRLRAVLKDLAPESKAANFALLSCLELGLHTRLLSQGTWAIPAMVDYLHEEKGLDKTLLKDTLNLLAKLLGLPTGNAPVSQKAKIPVPSAQPPASNNPRPTITQGNKVTNSPGSNVPVQASAPNNKKTGFDKAFPAFLFGAIAILFIVVIVVINRSGNKAQTGNEATSRKVITNPSVDSSLADQTGVAPGPAEENVTTKPSVDKNIFTPPNVGDFVFVKGGKFIMGCTPEMGDCDDDEKPEHRVKVNSFYMAKTEVTQAQWEAIMGNNPSEFKNNPQNPVENVSWDDVQEFIKKLNQREGGKAYRLPTEAEWEYAARGGNKPDGTMYAGSNNIDEVAWYDGNSGFKTHPVAQKKPNSLDIYDMTGNVWEMCADIYAPYTAEYMDNPNMQTGGGNRVNRGGSWYYVARNCRVSSRYNVTPSFRNSDIGFRLLRVVRP